MIVKNDGDNSENDNDIKNRIIMMMMMIINVPMITKIMIINKKIVVNNDNSNGTNIVDTKRNDNEDDIENMMAIKIIMLVSEIC